MNIKRVILLLKSYDLSFIEKQLEEARMKRCFRKTNLIILSGTQKSISKEDGNETNSVISTQGRLKYLYKCLCA